MRKLLVASILFGSVALLGGCRSVYGTLWQAPKFVEGKVFDVYTGNGHFDGKTRWNNFTQNWQQIENVVDIYLFNYDIRDPYLGAPYFGDPH